MINYFGSLASPISMQIMINKEAIPIFNNATGPGNRLIQCISVFYFSCQVGSNLRFQSLSITNQC